MSTTPLDVDELDNLTVEIHFKENSIPSIHAGKLTEESKQRLTQLTTEAKISELEDLPSGNWVCICRDDVKDRLAELKSTLKETNNEE